MEFAVRMENRLMFSADDSYVKPGSTPFLKSANL